MNVAHTQNQEHDDWFSKTISNFEKCEKAWYRVSLDGNGVLTSYINKEWGRFNWKR